MIHFGTAGLRALMKDGDDYMNARTVAIAAHAIAGWLTDHHRRPKFALAYDARHNSATYAHIAATLLAAHGVTVQLFSEPTPTPLLVFSIDHLKTQGGGIITASHNPKDYNGFKVYNHEAIQIGDSDAEQIAEGMQAAKTWLDSQPMLDADWTDLLAHPSIDSTTAQAMAGKPWTLIYESYQKAGMIQPIKDDVQQAYHEYIKSLWTLDGTPEQVDIVYTPVHGVGGLHVPSILTSAGFEAIHMLERQALPDGDFPTAPSPNPEQPNVMDPAIAYAKNLDADLVLATDPDADRAICAIKKSTGQYVLLTGCELGGLLTYLLIEQKEKQGEAVHGLSMVKSLVTDGFGAQIAIDKGLVVKQSLTGFKHICGQYPDLVQMGHKPLLGYEESIGYAIGERIKDKDGIAVCRILAGAAATYRQKGWSLWDLLNHLRKTYGYHLSRPFSVRGLYGQQIIDDIVNHFRQHRLFKVGDAELVRVKDYQSSAESMRMPDDQWITTGLKYEQQNLIIFEYNNGSWFALRPSGTEPKLKFYLYAYHPSRAIANMHLDQLEAAIDVVLNTCEVETHTIG